MDKNNLQPLSTGIEEHMAVGDAPTNKIKIQSNTSEKHSDLSER